MDVLIYNNSTKYFLMWKQLEVIEFSSFKCMDFRKELEILVYLCDV